MILKVKDELGDDNECNNGIFYRDGRKVEPELN